MSRVNDQKELIVAVESARDLLRDAGFQYTWVAGVKSVDKDLDNMSFTLNGHTWDRYMPNVALLALAADMLGSVHKKSGMSLEDMFMIILKYIADNDDEGSERHGGHPSQSCATRDKG